MKKYRLTAFIISFCLAAAVCMLSANIAYQRQASTQFSREFGLPESYYKITVGFSGEVEELAQNTILNKLFEVLSNDDEAIAIFPYDPIYLYDPSGYYNTEELKGGYFSKEDFQSGIEKGVLIEKDSPYSLMNENGMIYCFGEYRDVVGEYSVDYPLRRWSASDAIECLSPGYLPQKWLLNGSVNVERKFYLANCEKDLFDKVKEAFSEAGWTVAEDVPIQDSIYGNANIILYLIQYRNGIMVIILLIIMGSFILRHAACSGRKSTYAFRKGFSYGIIPSLAGCLAGNAVITLCEWFDYNTLLCEGVLPSAGIVMFIMLLLMAIAWMGVGKKEKGTHNGNVAGIKKVCVPVMVIVFSCLTVWLSYDNIESLNKVIKHMKTDNIVSEINGVQFRALSLDSIIKETKGKHTEVIEQAIKEGKAFAFIQSYDHSYSIVVGSEAFRKIFNLDLVGELPAAYAPESYKGLKNGEDIGVGKYAKSILVPVVKYLNDDVYNSLTQEFTDNSGPVIIMDLEDFVESEYEIIDAAIICAL